MVEGTINGAGAALDRFEATGAVMQETDPDPDAFCLPDVAGLGSPHWRPDIGLRFSEAAEKLDPIATRRVVLEGLLFRIRQILNDLTADIPPHRILLSGGVTGDPLLAEGLAALIGREVEVLKESEAGLIGAARLAAGMEPYADPSTTVVQPGSPGAYLSEKYESWSAWLRELL